MGIYVRGGGKKGKKTFLKHSTFYGRSYLILQWFLRIIDVCVLCHSKTFQANPESPLFISEYHSTEQAITITFKTLSISLHQAERCSSHIFFISLNMNAKSLRIRSPLLLSCVDALLSRNVRSYGGSPVIRFQASLFK